MVHRMVKIPPLHQLGHLMQREDLGNRKRVVERAERVRRDLKIVLGEFGGDIVRETRTEQEDMVGVSDGLIRSGNMNRSGEIHFVCVFRFLEHVINHVIFHIIFLFGEDGNWRVSRCYFLKHIINRVIDHIIRC